MKSVIDIVLAGVLTFFMSFPSFGQIQEKERWIVEESSAMRVKGSSNVNKFTCSIESRTKKDTLSIDYAEGYGHINFVKNEVNIEARAFDCQNKLITSDMQETLKADKYPFITLTFLSIEKPTFQNFSSQSVKGKIRITIAGESNVYPIKYDMTPGTDGSILLKGKKEINIEDFDLEAPSKMFGMIQVDELIEVNFNMLLKQLL